MKALLFILFATAGAFSSWTLLVWTSIVAGFTPGMLHDYWIPVVFIVTGGGIGTYAIACKSLSFFLSGQRPATLDKPTANPPETSSRMFWLGVLASLVSIAIYWTGKNQTLFWAMLVLSMLPALLSFTPRPRPRAFMPLQMGATDWLAVVLAGLSVWLMHSFRPYGHTDDTHFLDAASSFLTEPQYPLFAVDTLFQEYERANLVYSLNIGQSWDALAGYLALLTGVNLHTIYYGIMPTANALMFAATLMLFLKVAQLRFAAAGVLLAVVLFYQLSYGGSMAQSFLEGRLYQGKAALINIYIPLLFCVAYLQIKSGTWHSLLLMSVLLVAAAGASSTGLYLAPTAAGIALLSFSLPSLKSVTRAAWLTVLISMPPLAALLVFYVFRGTADVMVAFSYPQDQMLFKFGGEQTGHLQLLSYYLLCVTTFFLAIRMGRHTIAVFSLTLLLLVLCPLLPDILGDLSGIMNLYWRYYWLLPVGLLLAVFCALTCELAWAAVTRNPARLWIALLTAFSLLAISQSRIVQKVIFNVPESTIHIRKVGKPVSGLITYFEKLGDPEAIIVAPPKIARNLNLFPSAPKQVYVQAMYLKLIQSQVSEEYLARIERIMSLMEQDQLANADLEQLLSNLEEFKVTHAVFRKSQVNSEWRSEEYFQHCGIVSGFLVCVLDPG